MPTITVGKENSGNIDLYYEDHGTGNPVILVHGWPLSGASWEKQVPVLLEAGHRVITYDRRGFGESSKPTTGYDYDTFAEDLHKLVTTLNLKDAALVGFSMGGGEVARYLGKYGNKQVSKAVFISSIPPFLLKTPDNQEGVDGSVFDGIKKGLPPTGRRFSPSFSRISTTWMFWVETDQRAGRSAQLELGAGASPKGTLDCVSAWLTDFRNDLKKIDVPTLVIHGDSDRILPLSATGKRTPQL